MCTVRSCLIFLPFLCFFFFNDTATTEIYTLSLHDALPISTHPSRASASSSLPVRARAKTPTTDASSTGPAGCARSEEHTSELQSPCNLVCRLLLEKKKKNQSARMIPMVDKGRL